MEIFSGIGRFLIGCGGLSFAYGIKNLLSELTGTDFYTSEEISTPILIGIGFALVGGVITYFSVEEEQRLRDYNANIFLEEKGETNFALYLRPFLSTGKLFIDNPYHNSWGVGADRFEDSLIDLETLFVRNKPEKYEFFALGRPGEHWGAGRMPTTEENWWEEFKESVTKAKLVFILPGYQSGIVSEISWIYKNNFTSKCIFIMPSESSNFDEGVEEYWHKTIEAIKETTVELPSYNPNGCFLGFSNETFFTICELKNLPEDIFLTFFDYYIESNSDDLAKTLKN